MDWAIPGLNHVYIEADYFHTQGVKKTAALSQDYHDRNKLTGYPETDPTQPISNPIHGHAGTASRHPGRTTGTVIAAAKLDRRGAARQCSPAREIPRFSFGSDPHRGGGPSRRACVPRAEIESSFLSPARRRRRRRWRGRRRRRAP